MASRRASTIASESSLRETITALAETFARTLARHCAEMPLAIFESGSRDARTGTPIARRPRSDGADAIAQRAEELLRDCPQGLHAEVLRAELGIERAPFHRAMQRALERGTVKREGERRATLYLPA